MEGDYQRERDRALLREESIGEASQHKHQGGELESEMSSVSQENGSRSPESAGAECGFRLRECLGCSVLEMLRERNQVCR